MTDRRSDAHRHRRAVLLAVVAALGACGDAAPAVSGLTPSSGPVSGSTVVTITGTGFASGAGVAIGGAQSP